MKRKLVSGFVLLSLLLAVQSHLACASDADSLETWEADQIEKVMNWPAVSGLRGRVMHYFLEFDRFRIAQPDSATSYLTPLRTAAKKLLAYLTAWTEVSPPKLVRWIEVDAGMPSYTLEVLLLKVDINGSQSPLSPPSAAKEQVEPSDGNTDKSGSHGFWSVLIPAVRTVGDWYLRYKLIEELEKDRVELTGR